VSSIAKALVASRVCFEQGTAISLATALRPKAKREEMGKYLYYMALPNLLC
jgi:hypothetical protein